MLSLEKLCDVLYYVVGICFIAYFKMALFFRLYIFKEINLDNSVYVFNCPYSFRPQSLLNNFDILYYKNNEALQSILLISMQIKRLYINDSHIDHLVSKRVQSVGTSYLKGIDRLLLFNLITRIVLNGIL